MSAEQRENLEAILRQSACPVGSDVSEPRRLLRELTSAQPLPADVTVIASFSSDAASHCCRWPFSCQTALQRPCVSRAGYTVIPHSSSVTGPPAEAIPSLPALSQVRGLTM